MRILFADDQEDIRALTTYHLERSGHHVRAVADGRAALSALLHEHFDVALLDEEMPEMGGVELAHAIRENEARAGSHAFLIALTGNSADEDVARLRGEGFDAVLAKPFRLEALSEILDAAGGAGARSSSLRTPSPGTSAGIEDLLRHIGGDRKLLHKMIRTFLSDAPKRTASLQRALQRSDAAEIASLAHALKGSLGIFLAQNALDRARELEALGRKSELSGAKPAFTALKEEIAKLEENLRAYAVQTRGERSGSAAKRRSVRRGNTRNK
jgi:two-component system sensor histidine kinase/response regulator